MKELSPFKFLLSTKTEFQLQIKEFLKEKKNQFQTKIKRKKNS